MTNRRVAVVDEEAARSEAGDTANLQAALPTRVVLVNRGGPTASARILEFAPSKRDTRPITHSGSNKIAFVALCGALVVGALLLVRPSLGLPGYAARAELMAILVSLAVASLLVVTTRWHGRFSLDHTVGVQKFHSAPTPRIGGIAILAGLLAGWLVLRHYPTAQPICQLLGPMLLACIPASLFGLTEDLTKRVGTTSRLLATISSGAVVCFLTGMSLHSVGVWGLDQALQWAPLSIAFTAFAIGGVANAINIIDGFNGLAATTMLIGLTTIALIAGDVGDRQLLALCLLVEAAIGGFLLINFPFGKIFLGDGGAYAAGFMLAWIAVMLPIRNPSVSPWASLLACGYPVIEVAFSVWRKQCREGHRPGQPDKVHFHMLVHQRVAGRVFQNGGDTVRNSVTSLLLWPYAALPAAVALISYRHTAWLIVGFVVSMIVYRLLYLRMTQFRWCLRPIVADARQR